VRPRGPGNEDDNKLAMNSDKCYPPPPPQFLKGFKHILKLALKESGWGGTHPPSPSELFHWAFHQWKDLLIQQSKFSIITQHHYQEFYML
jgi:hypothetical protein